MTEAFERRAAEAMKRRKVPVESDTVIPLPDLTAGDKKVDSVDEPKEAPAEAKEDFFAVMPNEVPEAPGGGDFIIDPSADPSAPGVFTYAGHKLRPVNPAEYAKITATTANEKTRKKRGPGRLAVLLPPAGPADAPLNVPPGPEPLPPRAEATTTVEAGVGAEVETNNGDGGTGVGAADPEREALRQRAMNGLDARHAGAGRRVSDVRQTQPFNPDDVVARGRRVGGPVMPQGPLVAAHGPLVAPQVIPAGVIPDFIVKRMPRSARSRGVERAVPLTYEQGPTMDVILQDKKQQELFGELVKAHGPEELSRRYMAASEHPEAMQASDWAELGVLLDEFGHRKLLLEEVQNNLTKEDATFMLNHNPAFAALRRSLRPERALAVMKDSLAYMFMRGSHNDVNAMVLSQRANHHIRDSKYYKGLHERTHQRVSQAGVKPEDLNWNTLDPKLQRQILKPGLMKRMLRRQTTRQSEVTMEHIQTNRMSMGMLLSATISQDPFLISRIVREAQTGERVPQVGERGVGTAAEARTERRRINESLNEDALLERVRTPEFRAQFRDLDGRTWDNSTPEAREEAFFAPYDEQLAQRQTLFGWFSNFLRSLFEVRVDRARQRLTTANTFA